MIKTSFLLLCWLNAFAALAQHQLVFVNKTTGEVVRMHEGNKAALLYTGYNNQQEFIREIITEITDSTITLGCVGKTDRPGKRPNKICKTLLIKDITGFRKMSAGRLLAKSALSIASVFGSFYLLRTLYSTNMASGYSILASVGIGIAIIELNEKIFPENIKHYTEDNWSVLVESAP
jgi:hypothetical protein